MTLSPITCAAAGSGVCQEHRTGERRVHQERTRRACQSHVGWAWSPTQIGCFHSCQNNTSLSEIRLQGQRSGESLRDGGVWLHLTTPRQQFPVWSLLNYSKGLCRDQRSGRTDVFTATFLISPFFPASGKLDAIKRFCLRLIRWEFVLRQPSSIRAEVFLTKKNDCLKLKIPPAVSTQHVTSV